MRMKFLSGGKLQMNKSIFVPNSNKEEKITLPVISTFIEHKSTKILFDTGCHPNVYTEPEKRWGQLAKIMKPVGDFNDNLILNLKKNSIEPTDIDLVINSHLHPDHCGCNEFFVNAEFICSFEEIEVASKLDAKSKGYISHEWQHPMPLKGIKEFYDVFDDGRLITIALPGHTPGSIGLQVNTDKSGSFIIASDAISLERNIKHDEIPKNAWDGDLLLNSYQELRNLENRGFQLIYGHDYDQWEILKQTEQYYE
jgi:N-acyl homoserine lactone hydrolase